MYTLNEKEKVVYNLNNKAHFKNTELDHWPQ